MIYVCKKEFYNTTFKGDTMYFPRDEHVSLFFFNCNIEGLTLENATNIRFSSCNVEKLDLVSCFGATISDSSIDYVAFYKNIGPIRIQNSNINDLYIE